MSSICMVFVSIGSTHTGVPPAIIAGLPQSPHKLLEISNRLSRYKPISDPYEQHTGMLMEVPCMHATLSTTHVYLTLRLRASEIHVFFNPILDPIPTQHESVVPYRIITHTNIKKILHSAWSPATNTPPQDFCFTTIMQ